MSRLEPTARTTLKRAPQRGSYERSDLHAILDEGLVCHLAFASADSPHVIPTAYARVGETVYIHGAVANRALRALADGGQACLSVTLVDGLVLARSAFHTSMNYRSAILYGDMHPVTEPDARVAVLRAIVEHMVPGRWNDVREPNEAELKRTLVLGLPIDEASAKVRTGPPIDDEEDMPLPCWAGVIPTSLKLSAPLADPQLDSRIPTPDYVAKYRRGSSEVTT